MGQNPNSDFCEPKVFEDPIAQSIGEIEQRKIMMKTMRSRSFKNMKTGAGKMSSAPANDKVRQEESKRTVQREIGADRYNACINDNKGLQDQKKCLAEAYCPEADDQKTVTEEKISIFHLTFDYLSATSNTT